MPLESSPGQGVEGGEMILDSARNFSARKYISLLSN